ncbi:DUF3408 domain-containing protein [Chryseobacterium foetidum]|uniref:DUF3408 domain-containing protein n=1 Tax=Chryseobacterium foetidum TaxID=2951057 RepID=UPI0021CAC6AF|nr:DUF3408 domain-containing protein [Chryseobacterium foetidum]
MEKKTKKDAPVIDEQMMMDMMVDGVKKDGLELPEIHTESESDRLMKQAATENKPVPKERGKTKKLTAENYGDRFLTTHSMAKRGDKSIYIRQEYHERLTRIVQVIGDDNIPLYAYLDNILEHHFDMFENAITEDFNNKFKPLF